MSETLKQIGTTGQQEDIEKAGKMQSELTEIARSLKDHERSAAITREAREKHTDQNLAEARFVENQCRINLDKAEGKIKDLERDLEYAKKEALIFAGDLKYSSEKLNTAKANAESIARLAKSHTINVLTAEATGGELRVEVEGSEVLA